MSKIIDLLREVPLNHKKVVETKLIDTDVTEHVAKIVSHLEPVTAYAFVMEFGVKGYAQDTEEIGDLRRNARKAVTEEIFGEFRPMILLIERALWDRDFAEARRRLQKLEATMFAV